MIFAEIMKTWADCENNPLLRQLRMRDMILEQQEELMERCADIKNEKNASKAKNEAH